MADQYDYSMIGQPQGQPGDGSPSSTPMSQSTSPTYDYSMIGQSQGQPQGQSQEQPQTSSSSTVDTPSQNIGDYLHSKVQELKSAANAATIGFERGVSTFSSTLQKLITPYSSKALKAIGVPDKYINTPEQAQQTYNELDRDYQTNPDSVAHPFVSGLANLAGQAAMTAPLQAATGGAASALSEGSSLLGGVIARGASNVALGGTMGGLSNTQGQDPNQTFNPKNAAVGMLVGGVLSPAQEALGSFTNSLTKTENLQNSLAQQGFKTRPMASDVGEGMSGSATKWLSNTVLNKVPVVGNMGYRGAQGQNLSQDIQNYVGDLSQSTLDSTKAKIANTIQAHADKLDGMENDAWDDFKDALQRSPVPNTGGVPRTLSQPGIDDLLANPASLGTKFKNSIQDLPENMSPEDHLDLARNVWQQYKPLQNKINMGNATVDDTETANTLRNTYFNMKDDLGNAIQGTPAEPAFQTANAMTQANKSLFDPKYNKQLVNAVSDMNDSQRGIDQYVSWLTNPKTNTRDVQTQIGFLGNEGTDAVSQLGLKNMLAGSLDQSVQGKPVLNLQKFMNSYNSLPQSAQALIHQPAIDAMQGLQTVAGHYLTAMQGPEGGMANQVAAGGLRELGIGGAVAGGVMNPAVGIPAAVGTGMLSFMSRYSPVKQALINVNNASKTVGMNPNLSQYLLQKAQDVMIRNGVTIGVDHTGKVQIDKQDQQTGTKRQLQESMNSRSPGQQPAQQPLGTYNPSLPGSNDTYGGDALTGLG